jgi:putative ABC transport system substrate-binding protein
VIDRRTFLTAAGAVLLAAPVAAEGQARKAGKIPRIGILSPFSTPSGTSPSFDAFRVGLRESGWIEGRNFTTEYRWAEGKYERLPALAADLVRLKVDVIFSAWSTPAALAAKHAAKTIPIVFVGVGDAVGVGLIESLARPAGNITGATFITEETIGKQLQLLKEAVPRLSRAGTLSNPANPVYGPALKDIEAMGRTLHVEVQHLGVQSPDDLDSAFDAATRSHVGGLVVLRDAVLIVNQARLLELAAKHRLPAMYGMREPVEAGGLISFGPSLPELYRLAAQLVNKILKGAKPADLPVEQATKFELVINLKTAKALGLAIPPSLLARADEIVQ